MANPVELVSAKEFGVLVAMGLIHEDGTMTDDGRNTVYGKVQPPKDQERVYRTFGQEIDAGVPT